MEFSISLEKQETVLWQVTNGTIVSNERAATMQAYFTKLPHDRELYSVTAHITDQNGDLLRSETKKIPPVTIKSEITIHQGFDKEYFYFDNQQLTASSTFGDADYYRWISSNYTLASIAIGQGTSQITIQLHQLPYPIQNSVVMIEVLLYKCDSFVTREFVEINLVPHPDFQSDRDVIATSNFKQKESITDFQILDAEGNEVILICSDETIRLVVPEHQRIEDEIYQFHWFNAHSLQPDTIISGFPDSLSIISLVIYHPDGTHSYLQKNIQVDDTSFTGSIVVNNSKESTSLTYSENFDLVPVSQIKWYKDGNFISATTSTSLSITQNGYYSAILYDNNGCKQKLRGQLVRVSK